MGVNSITAGSAVAQNAAAPSTGTTSSKGSSSASGSAIDTASISQKAKDMAAQQAGKSVQEDMQEPLTAKAQEGSNS